MKKILCSFLLTATVAVGFTNCSQIKTVDAAKLEGYWVLNTMEGKEAKTMFDGPQPSIQFNFTDSLISGTAGCNRYFGKFSLSAKNEFSAPNLGATRMMCFHKNEEASFLSLMSQNELNISVSDDNQTLYIKRNEAAVFEFSKGEEPSTAAFTSEVATSQNVIGKWQLKVMKDEDVAKLFGEGKRPTMEFSEGSDRVSGNAGCNGYGGSAEFEENGTIRFGQFMSTMMACPNLEGEQKYLKALNDPVQATIDNSILTFRQDNVVVMEFEKIEG